MTARRNSCGNQPQRWTMMDRIAALLRCRDAFCHATPVDDSPSPFALHRTPGWTRLLVVVSVWLTIGATACGPDAGSAGEWTPAEREAIDEFVSGLVELRDGLSVLNAAGPELSDEERERALEHLRRAREQTAGIGDSVLVRIHPELPVRVQSRLRRGIEDRIRSLNGAHPYRFVSGYQRLNDWAEWYDETRSSWNLPGR